MLQFSVIYTDISKAKKLLGWNSKITLEEGLKKIFPEI